MSVKDKLEGLEKGDTFHVMDISDYHPTEKDRNIDEEFFHGDHTIKKIEEDPKNVFKKLVKKLNGEEVYLYIETEKNGVNFRLSVGEEETAIMNERTMAIAFVETVKLN